MGRGLDNYFLILGMDFNNPESDIAVIEQRIKEKVKEWNKLAERGKMQQKYRQYKAMVFDIGNVMKTENLRLAEAKDAQSFVNGILKTELALFAGAKEIEEPAANAIMEKAGIWSEIFEQMSGLKIVKNLGNAPDPKVNPNPEPENVKTFKQYEPHLRVLNKKNLYDFLAGDSTTDIIGLQTLKGKELIASYSNPLKERVKYEKTEEASSTRTLCAACEDVFDKKETELRANYDKFIIWQQIDDIMKFMVKVAGTSKKLTADQKRQFTDRLTQIIRSREKAVQLMEQICAYKDLTSGAPVAPNPNKVLCGRCYSYADISKGQKKCSNCGSDLYIICPKCGKEILSSLAACGHCGFKLDDVQRVETLCRIAQKAVLNMDFEAARSNLAKAEQILTGYSKIAPIKSELVKRESEVGTYIDKIEAHIKKREIYAAYNILQKLKKKAPTATYSKGAIIDANVAQAETLYKQAVSEKSEDKLLQLCSQINGLCPDYPGVESLMLKYRPKPVSNVSVTTDTRVCTTTLMWNPSPSSGEISYKVLRKEGTAAASDKDLGAELLGEAGTTKFVDTNPRAGVTYYYTVYAVRAGVTSEPVHISAVNLADVHITKKEEGDGFVKVEWKPLDKNAKVEVCRCERRVPSTPSDGVKINATAEYFRDDSVENDVQYGYLIYVNYHVEGKDVKTAGVTEMLIPSSVPEPVDDLSISSIDEDIFEATWTYDGKEKIVLYCTDTRFSLKYGDVTTIDKVMSLLKRVDSISCAPGRCRFRITDNKKYAIIPVTTKHSTAVIGEQAIAAKIEKIKIDKVELVSSNLLINMKWPEDAVSIMVIYGDNGYAKSLEDRKGKNVRTISQNQFLADTGLVIKNIEQKDYYITLYSICKMNGDLVYSDGTQVLFSNKPKSDITFSIKTKGLFSKTVEMEFTSSQNEFTLPAIDIIAKQGGVPVYATSGTVVEHIEEQQVTGSYKFTAPANSFPRESHLKPFFTDEKLYEKISLRPAYGTNFKVN